MIVNDRSNVRPRAINFGMDKSLGIQGAPFGVQRVSVEIEFDQIAGRHELGRQPILPLAVRGFRKSSPLSSPATSPLNDVVCILSSCVTAKLTAKQAGP